MAAQESQPETAAPSYMVNGKDVRKQMVITDDLRGFIGDVLAVDIELDKDDQQYSKVLCPPSGMLSMTSSTLVLVMSLPGLALFYGGMAQVKNVLSTVFQTFSIACLVSVLWFMFG